MKDTWRSKMLSDTEFAVVDVETTGLFRKGTDRIIEIAVLRVDSEGDTLDEYCTLVNPQRDLGPSNIHGITARQVRHAPSFREIAGDILTRLAGAVFVAHNAQFDKGFVRSEMDRLNCTLPDLPHLCTMRLAKRVIPAIPSRRLEELCQYFGISIGQAHSAYADARATASLLKFCVARLGDPDHLSLADLGVVGKGAPSTRWPALSPSGKAYRREDANCEIRSEPCYVAQVVARLPAANDVTEEAQEYLALLDAALEDRRISVQEADALLSLAADLGMGREQAVNTHRRYMRDLICVALSDGVLSDTEMRDLDEVRALLGISQDDYFMLFDEADAQVDAAKESRAPAAPKRLNLTGKTICFTGELAAQIDGRPATREDAIRAAEGRGMVVKTGVTKALDYLLAADPDTMSGKAKKARQYGVRIIAEPVFWNMVASS
ncbi:MAG: DNA polymerase III subunit epsilon [bacterium]|nr:DNA polymerase III subunit epsilon [bacterium]